ncbi:unnamed protein product [[Candida] boidinii]|nr:unnamed protein product [[Candida] boidinii]
MYHQGILNQDLHTNGLFKSLNDSTKTNKSNSNSTQLDSTVTQINDIPNERSKSLNSQSINHSISDHFWNDIPSERTFSNGGNTVNFNNSNNHDNSNTTSPVLWSKQNMSINSSTIRNHEDILILNNINNNNNNNTGGSNLNLDSDTNNFDPQQTPTMMRMSRFFPSPLIEQRKESSAATNNNNNNDNNNTPNNGGRNYLGARSHSAGFIPAPSPLNFDMFSPSVGSNIGLITSNLSSNNGSSMIINNAGSNGDGNNSATGSSLITSFSTPIKARTPSSTMDPYSNIPSNSLILGSANGNANSSGISNTATGGNSNGSLSVTPGTLNGNISGISGLPQPFDEFALNAQAGSSPSINTNTSVNVNGIGNFVNDRKIMGVMPMMLMDPGNINSYSVSNILNAPATPNNVGVVTKIPTSGLATSLQMVIPSADHDNDGDLEAVQKEEEEIEKLNEIPVIEKRKRVILESSDNLQPYSMRELSYDLEQNGNGNENEGEDGNEETDIDFSLPISTKRSKTKLAINENGGVLKYIKSIITMQPDHYMVYVASLPYDTPISQCKSLIRTAFKQFGEITNLFKDDNSKSKISPERDLFIRFKIVSKLFDDNKTPFKIHKFINDATGRDSKMMLFFDSPSYSSNGDSFTSKSGKADISSHPEGFASTFHRRGVNNFMFVRELQSKIIINKARSNGNGNGYETAEFRISLPIEELNLGLSDDTNVNGSGGNGHGAGGKIEDYRNSRRIKRSFIVNIDLRELENKPGYNHHNNHHSNHHSYSNNNSSNGSNKKHYYSDRGYNNYKN